MLSASMVAPGMNTCSAAGYVVFTVAWNPFVSSGLARPASGRPLACLRARPSCGPTDHRIRLGHGTLAAGSGLHPAAGLNAFLTRDIRAARGYRRGRPTGSLPPRDGRPRAGPADSQTN